MRKKNLHEIENLVAFVFGLVGLPSLVLWAQIGNVGYWLSSQVVVILGIIATILSAISVVRVFRLIRTQKFKVLFTRIIWMLKLVCFGIYFVGILLYVLQTGLAYANADNPVVGYALVITLILHLIFEPIAFVAWSLDKNEN